jgi:broad specificity phosphatase PhoE
MKIYFTRHGESQANTLRILSCCGLKHPLTLQGRQQAMVLANKLHGCSINRIYASPVLRAIETGVILANRLGVEYEIAEALRECEVGSLEDRSDEAAWQELHEVYDDWILHRHPERRIGDGENLYDVQKRFVPFIDGLVRQWADMDENLLCVAHGGLYWTMLPLVLINVDAGFIDAHGGIDYAACIVVELRPEGLACIEWNGVNPVADR